MAEYLLLATFITVLSVSTVWTIRTFQRVGKAFYQAILPSRKGKIMKSIFAEETLPTLCEKLPTIRMPWGWRPLESVKIHNGSYKAPRAPVIIPWGWPGSTMQANGHIINRHAMIMDRAGHAGPDTQTNTKTDHTEDLPLGIRGNIAGGYHLVTAGQIPLSDARSPWGW